MEDYTNKYKGEQIELALFGGEYQEGVLTAYCSIEDVPHVELNGHILVPLVLWRLGRAQAAYVDEHGRAALNFQISVALYAIAVGALSFVLVGLLLIPGLAGFHIVLMIVASVRASQGEPYRYPLTIRLL